MVFLQSQQRWSLFPISALAVTALLCTLKGARGCSRVAFKGGCENETTCVIVGRSMDWAKPTNSSMWAFPAGLKRDGAAGSNSLQWVSKYGSVITTMYDVATVDGINSAGLVGNTLYLADGEYGARDLSRPGLSIGLWEQYFLDNYATVAEAVADLYTSSGAEKFQIATKEYIPGIPSIGHLTLADNSGDNAVMEYYNGKLVVHYNQNYTVVTNEPSYEKQLNTLEYWAPISKSFLPGTERSEDRFIRLSHYDQVAPQTTTEVLSYAAAAAMIRAVSVPTQPIDPSQPNIAPTEWRTFADSKFLIYTFESALRPTFMWVDLNKLDLTPSGHTKVLTLNGSAPDRLGEQSAYFVEAPPFKPITVND